MTGRLGCGSAHGRYDALMARTFDGSTDDLTLGSAVVSAAPFTLACWGKSDDVTADQVPLSIGDTGSNANWAIILFRGTDADDDIQAGINDGSASVAASVEGFVADTWVHAACVFESSASRYAYANGTASAQDTASVTPTLDDETTVGARRRAMPDEHFSGAGAWPAVWSSALSANEAARLAAGASPLTVSRSTLRFFARLNFDEDRDMISGTKLAATGSPSTAAHPDGLRRVLPRGRGRDRLRWSA